MSQDLNQPLFYLSFYILANLTYPLFALADNAKTFGLRLRLNGELSVVPTPHIFCIATPEAMQCLFVIGAWFARWNDALYDQCLWCSVLFKTWNIILAKYQTGVLARISLFHLTLALFT